MILRGTVKLGDKERLEKEQIGVSMEPFFEQLANLLQKD